MYLAQAFLDGRLDLRGVPEFYQDLVTVGGKVYMPFPPLPAVLMLPSVTLWGTAASQVMVSKVVGAVNVGLMWLVLGKLKVDKKLRWLLTIFFGFGTGHWYAAVWGTTWWFAHVVGVMFLLVALLLFFSNKSPLFIGLAVGAAALSRHPMIGAAVFFGLMWFKEKQWLKLVNFGLGLGVMLGVLGAYNFLRFGNMFEEGYVTVAEQYRQGNYPYTILLKYWPNAPRFGYMDVRNIPLHLFTALGLFPETNQGQIRPSPYGMSLILTSPLLVWVWGKPRRDWRLWQASLAAIGATSIPILLHFTQGWVQFGYRFMLDFIPWVIIILALRLKKVTLPVILLTLISVGVNWWGVEWGKKLGW